MMGIFTDGDNQRLDCSYNTSPPSGITGEGTSTRSNIDESPHSISFQEAATFSSSTVITLHCGGFKTFANHVVLTAFKVGTCHSDQGENCGVF